MKITFSPLELNRRGLLLEALKVTGLFVDPSMYNHWPPKLQGMNHIQMMMSEYALGRDIPYPYSRNLQLYLGHEEITLTEDQCETLGIGVTFDKVVEAAP